MDEITESSFPRKRESTRPNVIPAKAGIHVAYRHSHEVPRRSQRKRGAGAIQLRRKVPRTFGARDDAARSIFYVCVGAPSARPPTQQRQARGVIPSCASSEGPRPYCVCMKMDSRFRGNDEQVPLYPRVPLYPSAPRTLVPILLVPGSPHSDTRCLCTTVCHRARCQRAYQLRGSRRDGRCPGLQRH